MSCNKPPNNFASNVTTALAIDSLSMHSRLNRLSQRLLYYGNLYSVTTKRLPRALVVSARGLNRPMVAIA